MNTGKIASKYYDKSRIPKGATALGQFGNIISVQFHGQTAEYEVKEGDTFQDIDAALEELMMAGNLVEV